MRALQILLFGIAFFCLSSDTFAQQTENEQKIQEYKDLSASLEGYYQIQIINSRAKPTIGFDLLKEIEVKRSETQNSFIQHTPYIKVLVLGKNEPAQFTESDKIVYLRE